jgi:transcriptional antiterminator Rof (Rho-off)
VDQSERYSGHIMVELQILDGNHLEGTASAEARRSITVPENLSLREREEVWYQLTEDILADLNRELEKVINSTYAPYLL